ncbi:MAG: peptide chain release factor N(5)-glutamine methyltransferase [Pelovirga sp.]
MSVSWTLLQLLRWMTGYFADKGIVNPRLDAELLLAHLLQLDRVGLYLNYDRPLSPVELEQIRPLVKRRGRREPLQYLLGTTDFWSLTFAVSPAVLIPRADTEILVEEALKRAAPTGRLLDAGTGSGVILISLLHELPGWQGLGLDISAAALAIARRNAVTHGLAERLQLQTGDLARLPAGRYDLIVSNPPYIAADQWLELMPEVRDFEPALALQGGIDGLDCYRRLAAQARDCLEPGGWLLVEIGASQGEAVATMFAAAGLTGIFQRADYGGNPRVVGGQCPG